ncbi:MAG TPA: PP0621 family protein [Burkholderiaceae bacterium]|nr:PP0621 family protein [Burkholderiaceae bacterium]
MKFVIFVVAIVLLLWLVFGRRRVRRDAPPPPHPPASSAEGMVACAHCGVHLPRSEAVVDGVRPYCSDAHRIAGPREPPDA